MNSSSQMRQSLVYLVISVLTFLVCQAFTVVMHEFTHSTVAWVLGYMPDPLGIVWGNPLTLKGWDEGVEYSRLYAEGYYLPAAVIGSSPLVLHAVIVTAVLALLQRKLMQGRNWLFHLLYWFMITNLMELVAYITMGAFWKGGDCYHFSHGLGLSPWVIFIAGTLAILAVLYILGSEVLPRTYAVIAPVNRIKQWVILGLTVVALFVWGSGLRVALAIYPDPLWMLAFMDFALLGLMLYLCRPSGSWATRYHKAA